MGCEKCSNGGSCGTGGNGSCSSGGGCKTGKYDVFNWLSNMQTPAGQQAFDCVEVRFKNGRKEYFRGSEAMSLHMGDTVVTEAEYGYDVGNITLTGELVRIQMRQRKIDYKSPKLPKIYRKATQADIDIWQTARRKEENIKLESRKIAMRLGLRMKISDIEFQGDASKATFYYTADKRVDFRQLIKELARTFRIRIEMRQIGLRQEAARIGGISTSGRELCCATWLKDFRSVSTRAARYQQLSLNPQKLAGQCGKLKCCLNFELDSYMDALKDFPRKDTRLKTKKGMASCQKLDIFKGVMWYAYEESRMNWFPLTTQKVKEIEAANKTGKSVYCLEDYVSDRETEREEKAPYEDGAGQDSLTRFDRPKKRKKNKRKQSSKRKHKKTHGRH